MHYVFAAKGCGLSTDLAILTQATLSVLVQNHAIELRDGPDTKSEMGS
jgi:hypothetical protein